MDLEQTTEDESLNQKSKESMDLEQPTNDPLLPNNDHSDRDSETNNEENSRLLSSTRSVDEDFNDEDDDEEDDNDNDNNNNNRFNNGEGYNIINGEEHNESSSWKKKLERVVQRTLLPDKTVPTIGRYRVVEGLFTVKLIKFIFFTIAFIILIHEVVPYLTDDRDRNLKLWEIVVFEGNLIVSDSIIFFLIGRMWQQNGVDRLEFFGWALLANILLQMEPYIRFLQHSVSLFEMHCVWPWQLWVFVVALIPLITNLIFLHLKYAYHNGIILMKVVELLVCALFFIAPLAPSPYFHLHHWYFGWFIGMHANFPDAWWSRAVMAYCWGLYINGIAVYGRDPVLTCEYSYFLSVDQGCPYMDCYQEALLDNTHATNQTVKQMITPNWKNCSADSYHP